MDEERRRVEAEILQIIRRIFIDRNDNYPEIALAGPKNPESLIKVFLEARQEYLVLHGGKQSEAKQRQEAQQLEDLVLMFDETVLWLVESFNEMHIFTVQSLLDSFISLIHSDNSLIHMYPQLTSFMLRHMFAFTNKYSRHSYRD